MSEMPIRVAVTGVGGRMGRTLVEACGQDSRVVLTGATEAAGSSLIGMDISVLTASSSQPQNVQVCASLEQIIDEVDVVIDFTRPEASIAHIELCAEARKKAVVGTTGFSSQDKTRIAHAATRTALVIAPNMSVGVNVVFKLLQVAAQALGNEVDVEVIEAHHRHKVDAPSGTAVRMGEVLAKALGRDLAKCAVYGREGVTGERDRETIGFETIRGGDIVGEHTVMFAGLGERIEITHRASSRMNFAQGALRAAAWLDGRDDGLFDMADVLGLSA